MAQRIRIDGGVFLWWALLVLILPPDWLLGAMLAAAFHEICHYLAARALGVPVYEIYLSLAGCRMCMGRMTDNRELLCAAAGPGGSLLLCCFLRIFPQLALCAMVQGLWNLLPVYPMDGGRIFRCLAGKFRLSSRQ